SLGQPAGTDDDGTERGAAAVNVDGRGPAHPALLRPDDPISAAPEVQSRHGSRAVQRDVRGGRTPEDGRVVVRVVPGLIGRRDAIPPAGSCKMVPASGAPEPRASGDVVVRG